MRRQGRFPVIAPSPKPSPPAGRRLRRQSPRRFIFAPALLLAATLSACGPATVSLDDALIDSATGRATLVAYVERAGALGLGSGVANRSVEFQIDRKAIGSAITDAEGRAQIVVSLPHSTARRVAAIASPYDDSVSASARCFHWSRERTIIAVDVDHTISDTEYESLLLKPRDEESDPISGSRKALRTLSRDFHILYLTARPRGLLDKTRAWLDEHEFPAGPVLTSAKTSDVIAQTGFRRRALADLRGQWPNLLIGIGDRGGDARAQAANGMLSILIRDDDDKPTGEMPSGTLIFEKWKHAVRFIERHHSTLADPEALTAALRNGTARAWVAKTDD